MSAGPGISGTDKSGLSAPVPAIPVHCVMTGVPVSSLLMVKGKNYRAVSGNCRPIAGIRKRVHFHRKQNLYNPPPFPGIGNIAEMPAQNIVPNTVATSAAHIEPCHGYAFDGDLVRLYAQIAVDAVPVANAEWAVQLWACATPFAGGELHGTKIAEVRAAVAAEAPAWLDATTTALPPAGAGEHAMVLVLASGDDGHFAAIHDYANYPHAERFVLPRLGGTVGYRIDGGSVTLEVGSVANPRPADNLSGSLALEFWALAAPYAGADAFAGSKLAGVDLGTLAGGCALDGLTFTLSCAGQPDGVWYPVLMLREWTAAGWVTRDYTAFAPSGTAAPLAAAPVAQAPAVETAPLAEAPVIEAPAAAPAVVEPAPAVKPAKAKARKAKAAASGPAVSVNTSTVTALAEVKGISKTVAAAIVAARPYASLDDLLRAKGVGAKLLEKLRAQLTL